MGRHRLNFINLGFLILVLAFSRNAVAVAAKKIIKYLPGFGGELPFTLETGYVTVGASEIFYYFIESEGNPKEDPLLLWYSGGPGCSAFNGLIYENGPLAFNITAYEGGLPPLEYYPYSWTKTASILFVDAPVGAGFSYSTTKTNWYSSDTQSAWQTYQFLRQVSESNPSIEDESVTFLRVIDSRCKHTKMGNVGLLSTYLTTLCSLFVIQWLLDHPQYLKLQLFVGADSYSGISATIVVKHILDGNKARLTPRLNLKGYILGAPLIDTEIDENSIYIFSNRIGLVSDVLFQAANEKCNGNFYNATASEPECYEDLQLMKKMIKDINEKNPLEPKCTWANPNSNGELSQRTLEENPESFLLSPPKIPDFWCRNFNFALSYIWANDPSVQDALGVRPGTVPNWVRCNKTLQYTGDVSSVLDLQRNLSSLGLQVLIYNGDHDLTVPCTGTQQWIRLLNLTIVDDWRPWLVDGQIAGYTIKYYEHGFRLTYATVKGAGHTPQEYKRRECFEMFDRFIHFYPI